MAMRMPNSRVRSVTSLRETVEADGRQQEPEAAKQGQDPGKRAPFGDRPTITAVNGTGRDTGTDESMALACARTRRRRRATVGPIES